MRKRPIVPSLKVVPAANAPPAAFVNTFNSSIDSAFFDDDTLSMFDDLANSMIPQYQPPPPRKPVQVSPSSAIKPMPIPQSKSTPRNSDSYKRFLDDSNVPQKRIREQKPLHDNFFPPVIPPPRPKPTPEVIPVHQSNPDYAVSWEVPSNAKTLSVKMLQSALVEEGAASINGHPIPFCDLFVTEILQRPSEHTPRWKLNGKDNTSPNPVLIHLWDSLEHPKDIRTNITIRVLGKLSAGIGSPFVESMIAKTDVTAEEFSKSRKRLADTQKELFAKEP